MLSYKYQQYYNTIRRVVSENRIFTSRAETLAYGTDASFYRLVPKIVIQSKTVEEVSFLLEEAHKLELPVTFRAAGTSLSGQAITDSILLITSQHWTNYEILDKGKKIKLEPGVIGARANIYLKPFGRKIGPDPASINAAMIGGIAANNASGMCCGTAQNSYKTVADMRIIFYDGVENDNTRLSQADKRFHLNEREFEQTISQQARTSERSLTDDFESRAAPYRTKDYPYWYAYCYSDVGMKIPEGYLKGAFTYSSMIISWVMGKALL